MSEQRFNVKFKKTGCVRYISHLDFVRFIYRALRRSDLPYVLTRGFNPHPKLQFGKALKLGFEGEMEVSFFFFGPITPEEFRRRFERQLVQGMEIIEINNG